MTSTAVVLGMAMPGTPVAAAGCDCAAETIGMISTRKEIMSFIGSPSSIRFGFCFRFLKR
jgi:hypothetical protein